MNESDPPAKIPRSRFTRRWWFWVAVSLLLLTLGLFTTVLVIREKGQVSLREVQAALRSDGLLTTPEELYKLAPTIDVVRMVKANALLKHFGDSYEGLSYRPLDTKPLTVAEVKKLASALALKEHHMVDLEAELSQGGLCMSSLAWLPHGVADPTRLRDGGAWINIPIPNLLDSRCAMNALCWSALIDQQHRQRFSSLLAMSAINRPVNTMIEAILTLAVDNTADDTVLTGILVDIVPDDIIQTWLNQPANARNDVALGCQGERVFWIGQLAGISSGLLGVWRNRSSMQSEGWGMVLDSLFLGHDAAIAISYLAACEQRLRGKHTGKPLETIAAEARHACLRTGASLILSPECAYEAIQFETKHRIRRLAGLCCQDLKNASGLPLDQNAFNDRHGIDACAAIGDLPALHYERLGPTRFRIGVHPAGSFTDLVRSAQIASLSDTGKVASSDPLVRRNWSIEIDVDQARDAIRTRLAAVSAERHSMTPPP